MAKGTVYDIMRFSTRDGPGIRTTVFLKGCPLGCLWCHNPESQSPDPQLMLRPNRCIGCRACLEVCPQGAIVERDGAITTNLDECTLCEACAEACTAQARELVGREMTVAQVMDEIERDLAFYDESHGGVTFSGGEPLMQPDFLRELLVACKQKEIHTAVDTSGFAPWPILDSVREQVDLFLYDLKVMDAARHLAYTAAPNAPILQNLRMLSQLGHAIIVRVPIIPGLNDDDEAIRQIGAFAVQLPRLKRIGILPYHQAGVEKYRRLNMPYKLTDVHPPSDERMKQVAQILAGFGLKVKIGG